MRQRERLRLSVIGGSKEKENAEEMWGLAGICRGLYLVGEVAVKVSKAARHFLRALQLSPLQRFNELCGEKKHAVQYFFYI